MTINKRKKNTRLRGSKTHGGGAMKKRRGAGHRGGRGRAGSGKRADQKKPSYQKAGKMYMGNVGFTSIQKVNRTTNVINIGKLDETIDNMVEKGYATKKGNAYEINLNDAGYQKLLSKGNTNKQLSITVNYASESVAQKLNAAGGKLTVLIAKKVKKDKKAKE